MPAATLKVPTKMPDIVQAADKLERKQKEAGNHNFIAHGSSRHIKIIGIRLADEHDEMIVETEDGAKWALVDLTAFGPAARPEYLKRVLQQKVDQVYAGPPPTPQSTDPFAPHYAPPMWDPNAPVVDNRVPTADELNAALDTLARLGFKVETP